MDCCVAPNGASKCENGKCAAMGCAIPPDGVRLANCTNSPQDGCADLSSSAAHCGACGNKCGEGAACERGECKCPANEAFCDGKCVSMVSEQHCGGCNNPCRDGEACVKNAADGKIYCTSCPPVHPYLPGRPNACNDRSCPHAHYDPTTLGRCCSFLTPTDPPKPTGEVGHCECVKTNNSPGYYKCVAGPPTK